MKRIRVAIAGVGNCASSLVQGLEYYKGRNERAVAGLMHARIADWGPNDIEIVAAFDIDRRKVGKRVEEAIFAKPNCTTIFQSALPVSDVVVRMGPVLDGVAPHMADYPDDEAFRPSDDEPVDVVQTLKDAKAEVLICYMPVGSEEGCRVPRRLPCQARRLDRSASPDPGCGPRRSAQPGHCRDHRGHLRGDLDISGRRAHLFSRQSVAGLGRCG